MDDGSGRDGAASSRLINCNFSICITTNANAKRMSQESLEWCMCVCVGLEHPQMSPMMTLSALATRRLSIFSPTSTVRGRHWCTLVGSLRFKVYYILLTPLLEALPFVPMVGQLWPHVLFSPRGYQRPTEQINRIRYRRYSFAPPETFGMVRCVFTQGIKDR